MTDLFGNVTEVKKEKHFLVHVVTKAFAISSKDKIIEAGQTLKIFDEIKDDFGSLKHYAYWDDIVIEIPDIFKKNYTVFLRKEKVSE